MGSKILVIAINGATFDIIQPMLERDELLNIDSLIKKWGQELIKNKYPPSAWSSIVSFCYQEKSHKYRSI